MKLSEISNNKIILVDSLDFLIKNKISTKNCLILTLIDGGLVTLATNDAFGVLQRDVYDNMEPKGRIESFDAGAIS